jgi:hypothetical protein
MLQMMIIIIQMGIISFPALNASLLFSFILTCVLSFKRASKSTAPTTPLLGDMPRGLQYLSLRLFLQLFQPLDPF